MTNIFWYHSILRIFNAFWHSIPMEFEVIASAGGNWKSIVFLMFTIVNKIIRGIKVVINIFNIFFIYVWTYKGSVSYRPSSMQYCHAEANSDLRLFLLSNVSPPSKSTKFTPKIRFNANFHGFTSWWRGCHWTANNNIHICFYIRVSLNWHNISDLERVVAKLVSHIQTLIPKD